jgi:hypothetical protein
MPVKIITILLFLFLNRSMFLEKGIYRQRFVWFYFSMIIIAMVNLFLSLSSFSANYFFTLIIGIVFWLMCIAAAFTTSWLVAKTDTNTLHHTVTAFFILNAAVTIGQLLLIIWDAGSINPFMYQGMHQKYFISTGDLLTGISFDVSTTNAIFNSFGVVYFLHRNKLSLVLLCMVLLLLTASNFTNILLVAVLLFLFIFKSSRSQKSVIVICFSLLLIFIIKISPQNNSYITTAYKRITHKQPGKQIAAIDYRLLIKKPDSILNSDEKKKKIAIAYLDSVYTELVKAKQKEGIVITQAVKPFIPKPNIHTEVFQRRKVTTLHQKMLLDFAVKNISEFDTSLKDIKSLYLPGKLIAIRQTMDFFKDHPLKIFTGNGVGNFSSKMAFRVSGLDINGSYPEKLAYINNDFLINHLKLYLSYFSKDAELHSLINTPNNFYDQLLVEYGLAGLFVFIFFYVAFFVKGIGKLTYGIPLLLLLLGAFAVDYWFEQLSIVILFELLMFINIKERKEQHA